MGHKKGFNWKARDQPGGSVDMAEVKVLNQDVDIKGVKDAQIYHGSNSLVMPAKKLKFQKEKEIQPVGRILSKKQRKRLEKIVDIKKKKAGRGELLEALAAVQVDSSVLLNLESLASVQTKGVKRQLVEEEQTIKIMQTEGKPIHEVQEDLKRNRKRVKVVQEVSKVLPSGADILGFESSASESEESDESEEDENEPDDPETELKDSDNDNKTVSGNNSENDVDTVNDRKQMNESDDKRTNICDDVKTNTKSAKDQPKDNNKGVVEVASSYKPATSVVFVPVNRDPDIIVSRNKLPIIGEEQQIMECINNNQVIILSGETGSGKTTQVPQFLYEAGYASAGRMIGITEPRRVAATAMSARVARELGLPDSEVSYQIRFQGNVTPDTKIKFMTDGVLLREIEKDFLLLKYSVVILDEAHERSVFTDILIGLLSRIVPLRHKRKDPLKLIIMSATLRVEDFTKNQKLFRSIPPVISVDSRQFPVTVHFNKVTVEDYLGETYRKVCKIHRQLPEGGILVFLTGQAEVNTLVKKLRQTFPGSGDDGPENEPKEVKPKLSRKKKKAEDKKEKKIDELPEINLDNYEVQPLEELECEGELSEDDEEDDKHGLVSGEGARPMHVLPLYSLLSQERQNRVFSPTPPGSRLCVVSTNIAETSLTIPGVKYVVDTGKVKTKFYDKITGVTTFVVTWISQAAGNQRAGRAGRQGPGHCYRLYSSAVFNNDLKDFSEPEIRQKPADGLLLQMKAMNIDKVVNFPFPSPPDTIQLRTAEERLQMLRLLTAPAPGLPLREAEKAKFTSTVTPLGRAVANFPVSPRFGKMLALAHQHNLLPLAVALVSGLSIQEVLVEKGVGTDADGEQKAPKQIMEIRRSWVGSGSTLSLGDPMVLLCALCISEKSGDTQEFCTNYGLRPKALLEIRRLRKQLCSEIEVILPGVGQILQPGLAAPTAEEARLLQQLLLAGCGDQVGRRMVVGEEGYIKGAYKIGAMIQPAFLHPSSVLRKRGPAWVIYQEVFETGDKIYLRCVTEIQPDWLAKYIPGLCNLGKALEEPPPRYCKQSGTIKATFKGTFGPGCFPLPEVEVEYPEGLEKYKQLGRFLLEGSVATGLEKFTSSLLSNPIVMVKSWSNLQPRTEILYKTLAAAKVDSAHSLKRKWEAEPTFLLQAYLAWLPEVLKEDVKQIWPPNVDLI